MLESIRDSKKSKNKAKRKRGRPITTGTGEAQIVRMHEPQLKAIDAWIGERGETISRPEAIRRLVELGLKAKSK